MEQLGRYQLMGVLGEGGAGRVYDAMLTGVGGFTMPVALKVLHRGSAALRREARIGGLLRHRNLVDVYEVGEVDGRWFCAQERCDASLADRLPLSPRAVVEVGLAVCEALGYAHGALELVHLDLKPANLLVRDGVVKVADLGIARAEGFGGDGRVRGTPAYMPPEQRMGGALDARSDIYALGITLVELAQGHRPSVSHTLTLGSLDATVADGLDPSATVDLDGLEDELPVEMAREALTSPASLDCPDWLAPVVARCLEHDPADRWQDMVEVAAALRELDAGGTPLREQVAPTDTAAGDGGRLRSSGRVEGGLLGRRSELAALEEALATPGLLTLRGPAGIGKSALAREVCHRWQDSGGDGLYCSLAEARDSGEVCGAVARVLELVLERSDAPGQLGHALASHGPLLLILDNFEQLLDHTALVDRWRQMAPELRLLLTSRAPLALEGERVVEVPPLSADHAHALLVARALERGADIATDPDLPALARRLEGVPLALELAAGRLGVLTVADVLERLDLSLLRQVGEGRHSTLRAALEWSWELLEAPDQLALAFLSVFEGGFTVSAAEAVLDGDRTLDAVDALLHSSLLVSTAPGRLGLLQSVQALGREKLRDRGAQAEAEARHGRWYARFGSDASVARLRHQVHEEDLPAMRAELENLVVAASRAVARGDAEVALRTALAAWPIFLTCGPFQRMAVMLEEVENGVPLDEGQRCRLLRALSHADVVNGHHRRSASRLDDALALASALDEPQLQAKLLAERGSVHHLLGERAEAKVLLNRALEAHRALGDRLQEGRALGALGSSFSEEGQSAQAMVFQRQAIEIYREQGNRWYEAVALTHLGLSSRQQGHLEDASRLYQQALEIHRSVGNRRMLGWGLSHLANLRRKQGRIEEATELMGQSREVAEQIGARRLMALLAGGEGTIHHTAGRLDQAADRYRSAEQLLLEIGDRHTAAIIEGNMGMLRVEQGRFQQARPWFERMRDLQRTLRDVRLEGVALRELATLDAREGDFKGALTGVDRAIGLADQAGDPSIRSAAWAARAEVCWRAGQEDEAWADWRKAESLAPAGDEDAAWTLSRVRALLEGEDEALSRRSRA